MLGYRSNVDLLGIWQTILPDMQAYHVSTTESFPVTHTYLRGVSRLVKFARCENDEKCFFQVGASCDEAAIPYVRGAYLRTFFVC